MKERRLKEPVDVIERIMSSIHWNLKYILLELVKNVFILMFYHLKMI